MIKVPMSADSEQNSTYRYFTRYINFYTTTSNGTSKFKIQLNELTNKTRLKESGKLTHEKNYN